MTAGRRSLLHAGSVLFAYTVMYVIFFAPVAFTGRLLAPDDGWTFFLPNYGAPHVLWNDLLFGGFPDFADVQAQLWYPPFRILSAIPGSWNAYVIAGYVLASAFAYGYAWSLTRSRLAAAVAGSAFGLSGVLIAHLRHVNFVHTAAWLPLLLWALHELRRRPRPGWFAAAALATALVLLGGFPQISVYGLGLSLAYVAALALASGPGRLRFLAAAAAALGLGLALTAMQVVPAVELLRESTRAHMRFEEFASYALTWRELALLAFPYFLGGAHGVPYAGHWNLAELSGYLGFLPLALAAVGFAAFHRTAVARFWLLAGVVALLLTLGAETPLAGLAYRLPGYRLFKVPTRHFVEVALAVSTLAGLGTAALLRPVDARGADPQKAARVALQALVAAFALALGTILSVPLAFSPNPGAPVPPRSLLDPALGIPLVVLLLAAAALVLWLRSPTDRSRQALVLGILVLDLASFGWLFEWRHVPRSSALEPPAVAERLRGALAGTGQRLLSVRGHTASRNEIPVNTSRLWRVPSAGGYNPLILGRVARLYPMANWGAVYGPWAATSNRAVDLMAIRYVLIPEGMLAGGSVPVGQMPEPRVEEGILLGPGCGGSPSERWEYHLPPGTGADRIEIVTSLRCAAAIPDGTPVLRVEIRDAAGRVHEEELRAGRDTAEWMLDCPDVQPLVRHVRPPVRVSFTVVSQGGYRCLAHAFAASLPLPSRDATEAVSLEWTGPSGAIQVHQLSMLDTAAGLRWPVDPETSPLEDPERWRLVQRLSGGVRLYENLRALPRAWLVRDVVPLDSLAVLEAVRTSRLPGGPSFDPRTTALVESSAEGAETGAAETGVTELEAGPAANESQSGSAESARAAAGSEVSVRPVRRSPTVVELIAETPEPALLVTSDVDYPGWKATVDARPTPVVRTDYVLRAVRIPAGRHVVRFDFAPRSLRFGTAATLVAAAALVVIVAVWRRRADSPRAEPTARGREDVPPL